MSSTFGVLGAAGVMGRRHVTAILSCIDDYDSSAEVLAYDRAPEGIPPGVTVCATEEEFFDNRQFDLLVIALHTRDRVVAYRHLVDGNSQARLVLLEKPLTEVTEGPLAVASGAEEFVKKMGDRTVVHFTEIFDPITELLLDTLRGDKPGVPKLIPRRIKCERSKNRESSGVPFNRRHSEPLAIQEGVHDVCFALHVLRSCFAEESGLPVVSLAGAFATDLCHPIDGDVPLAGSSDAIFVELNRGIPIIVENSFIDPWREKGKFLSCCDEEGADYHVYASHLWPEEHTRDDYAHPKEFEYRAVRVWNADGTIIYDARDDPAAASILKMGQAAIDRHMMQMLFGMLSSGRVDSNLALTLATEELCVSKLRCQQDQLRRSRRGCN